MKIFGQPILLPFTPEQEALWVQTTKQRFLPFLQKAILAGSVLNLSFLFWDYTVAPDDLLQIAAWRLGTVLVWLFLLVLTYTSKKIVDHIVVIGSLASALAALEVSAVLMIVENGFLLGLAGNLLPFFVVLIIPLPRAMILTAISIAFIIMSAMFLDSTPPDVIFNASFFIFGIMFFSSALGLLTINNSRKSFLLELNLEQARLEAEQADRVKSAFLATMSHEVRTPLNGVLGIVSLLDDTPLDKKQRGFVETIRYSGEALLTILNDILDFSKLEAGKLSVEKVEFDLLKLLQSVVDLMSSRASEKGILVQSFVDVDVPQYVSTDPTRLRQVLINLISNAIKFSERGSVNVTLKNRGEEGDKALLYFEVQDQGIGISPAAQAKLFKEFSQADDTISRKYGGTGLGLSICSRIVQLLGGSIGVRSEEGQGSTFYFEVPAQVVDFDPLLHGDIERRDTYVVTKPMRILLAEDNKVNQQVAVGLLQKFHHIITLAENGNEAVEKVKAQDFDLILMDMQMPVKDGLQATREIKALGGAKAAIPVIALTANAMRGDNERCLAAGMVDHIGKPVKPADLYNTIARHAPSHLLGEGQAVEARKTLQRAEEDASGTQIDLSQMRQLEKLLGEEYTRNFLAENLPELHKYVAKFDKVGGDMKEAFHVAHEIKSMSAMFGLVDISALAEAIEMASTQGEAAEVAKLIAKLKANYTRSLAELQNAYKMEVAA